MRGDNKLTVFASGNGDTILLEAHGKTVLTDIHYRRDGAEDGDNDEIPDFAPDIRDACPQNHLDVFVLTHPDTDHLGGADGIFHLGPPEDWNSRPEEEEPKVIIDEIWCSPYSVNPHYVTDIAKPMIDEIQRRHALAETDAGNHPGNRLVVMATSTHESGEVAPGIEWRLLAPTDEEWSIPEAGNGQEHASSNSASLVLQWTVTVGGGFNRYLLGGDATVEVWERIEKDIRSDEPECLAWHILIAPHHCSRHSIGRVSNSGTEDAEFEVSEEALNALGERLGDGFVVSSSKRIVRGAQMPPSFHAKNCYLKLLAGKGDVTEQVRDRFLCTGGEQAGDKPSHIVFNLTPSGPTRAQKTKASALAGIAIGSSSLGRGGGYGRPQIYRKP